MKDFEGTEIKVGDEVIQGSMVTKVKLRRRTVVGVSEDAVFFAPDATADLQSQQPHPRYRKRKFTNRMSTVTSPALLFVVPKVTSD